MHLPHVPERRRPHMTVAARRADKASPPAGTQDASPDDERPAPALPRRTTPAGDAVNLQKPTHWQSSTSRATCAATERTAALFSCSAGVVFLLAVGGCGRGTRHVDVEHDRGLTLWRRASVWVSRVAPLRGWDKWCWHLGRDIVGKKASRRRAP